MGKAKRGRTTPAQPAARWRLDATPEQLAVLKIAVPPEQRAAMTELQEQMREMSEKLGLRQFTEKLRSAPASPQQPQQRKPRQPGGGRRKKFKPEEQVWLRKRYSRDLKKNPRLAKHDGAVAHVKALAATSYGVVAERDTLLDHIIRPVLRSYFSMGK
jgi:hypothetical protein